MEKSVMLDHDFQYKPDKEKNAWSVRISHTHTHTHTLVTLLIQQIFAELLQQT